jgi:hypothetical protein
VELNDADINGLDLSVYNVRLSRPRDDRDL